MRKKPANYDRRVFSLNKIVSTMIRNNKHWPLRRQIVILVFYIRLLLLLSVLLKTEEKLYIVPLLNSE